MVTVIDVTTVWSNTHLQYYENEQKTVSILCHIPILPI